MKNIFILLLVFIVFLNLESYAQRPVEPIMIRVEGGTFNMGSNQNEDEKPIHRVTVASFRMGKYEVTVAEYKAFCAATGRRMPETPSWGLIDNHPITFVSYRDATAYCDWLTDRSGNLYRLPTEAEWEYAARGGNKSKGYLYSGAKDLEAVGWYDAHGDATKPVGQKQPNELGLYDMSGNVLEFCSDWYDGGYYAKSPASNPLGSQNGPPGSKIGLSRVMRGGSWLMPASYARVTYRYNLSPTLAFRITGFRVVSPE